MLTTQNFDDLVLGSKDIWFVEFYAPWCGHCQKLEPEWNEAASKLNGQVKFGKVDATVESSLGQRFGVKGYPSIKVFGYGTDKSDSQAKDYEGGRDASGLISHASQLLEKADVQPEIHELINQKIYDSQCQGQVICVLTFLPNIYDSNSGERAGYIETITSVAKRNRRHPFIYFWLQAGDQMETERQLNLGFGFPAVVAISPKKSKISILKGAFSEEHLGSFLGDLMSGRVALDDLKTKLAFKKADKWDGKDATLMEDVSVN